MKIDLLSPVYDYRDVGKLLLEGFFELEHETPQSPLTPFVDTIGCIRANQPDRAGFEFWRIPEGIVHIVCLLDGTHGYLDRGRIIISGPHNMMTPMMFGSEDTIVAQLRPGGAKPLLGVPADALKDRLIDASEIWGEFANSALERIAACTAGAERIAALGSVLVDRLKLAQDVDDLFVVLAAHWLRTAATVPRVDALVARSGYSERQTRRKFQEWLGLSPKQFLSTLRLYAAVRQAAPECEWAALARTVGYYDQAHMTNDFRSMLGVTPEELVRAPTLGSLRTVGAIVRTSVEATSR